MLPEVQAYYDALNDPNHRMEVNRIRLARREWDPTMSPDQVAAYFEAEDQREATLRELERAHQRKQAEAYQKLLASEDSLVRFLASDPEVRAYPQHAETVLRALPMSREEMEEFGDRQEWCHEYRRLLQRADEAGVLPAPTPDLADIEPLVREIADQPRLSERRLRTIVKKHLPGILASAEAKAAQRAQEDLPATA
ncbi:MAG TPA: hypothetical protein VFV66_21660 [Nonomuraea sp.]|nr:hypothetical protein [Nonomuraea sp.]